MCLSPDHRALKILSVTAFPVADDAASWRIRNIANSLLSKGQEVHLIQYISKSHHDILPRNGGLLSTIPSSVCAAPRAILHLKHLQKLSECDYDLVYGNTHLGAFFSVLSRLKKVPLVFDMHGGLVEELLMRNDDYRFTMRLLKLLTFLLIDVIDRKVSSKIACVSYSMMNYLREEKEVPASKLVYVPNGVDLNFFRPKSTEYRQGFKTKLGLADKFVFGYVGSFTKWQGVESLVKAAEMVGDPEIAFLVIGGERFLRKGNVLFIPRVPRSRLPDYYSACDVLVLPRPKHSATEIAAPTKFTEYTAMGKPVLATSVGDVARLLPKYKCGVLVEDNQPKTLLNGIMRCKSISEEDLKRMGAKARVLAREEFDWGRIGNMLISTMRELCQL